jgi:integrase
MGLYRTPGSPYWWMSLARPGGGRPVRRSTKIHADAPTPAERTTLRAAAEAIYREAQAKLTLQLAGAAPKPAIRVREYFEWYERHVTSHQRGAVRARSMLKHLKAGLGEGWLADLTEAQILEWRTARATAVSNGTVNRELELLKTALTRAIPQYLDVSPAARVRRLRHVSQPRRVLTREEERRLLAVLAPADRAIVVAALDTLLRAGDLLRLTWADDHGTYLTARNPKTGTPYEVPVSRRLRAALDALPRTSPLVFPHRQAGNGRATELWRMFHEGCLRAGLPDGRLGGLTFHGLRHTGASRMVEAGVDLRTVQAIGGWASLKQLSRYAHPTHGHLRAAVEAIGEGVSDETGTNAEGISENAPVSD